MSIDADNVGAWARRKHLGFSSYAELTQKPEVFELIAEHVARANEDLPEAARVRRFVLLARRLDADDRRADLARARRAARSSRSATRTSSPPCTEATPRT